jgi:CheY-like chemotaxis protein
VTAQFFLPDFDIVRASDGSHLPPPADGFHADTVGEAATPVGRVLVVDDERLIADTVAQILNLHGYDAFTAYGGPEALKLAERFRPDYLLTDVMMPVMNGLDLARAVEEILPSVKVLLFSGQAGTSALLQRQRVGDSHYNIVAKPIHPDKLVETLRNLRPRR